jgi:Eco57I restriction-modification methylase
MPHQGLKIEIPEEKPAASSDLHPHDPLLAAFFNELLLAKRELAQLNGHPRNDLDFAELLNAALISAADPSDLTSNPATARLRRLLEAEHFIKVLPVLVERLNTPVEQLNLPKRGKSRNLDRGELDTFYTPIDLAAWIATLTTKRACHPIVARAGTASPVELLRELSSLRVGDFSCGSGALLREAGEWIVRAYREVHRTFAAEELERLPAEFRFFKAGQFKLQCLSTNLFGIDISAKALESARLVLFLWALEEWRRNAADLPIVSRLLELNLRLGTGSHWVIQRDHVFGDELVRSVCIEHAGRRAMLRANLFAGERQAERNATSSEVVRMFPEAFVDETNPGFSCIVGNPPYGELPVGFEAQVSKSLFHGVPSANRSRNQYTKFASSLLHLLRDGGFGAIVCPLGLAYHNSETKNLRREIQNQNRQWNFAFFDRSPDALFGDMVKTRNVVLYCSSSPSGSPEIRTTHLIRWIRPLRSKLWDRIHPICIGADVDICEFVPKVGSEVELDAWKTIRSKQIYLLTSLLREGRAGDSNLYCYSTAYNWLPFFRSNPASFADERRNASPSTRQYTFHTPTDADFFYACLVSSLSFWLWTVESDGFHVTNGLVEKLPYAAGLFSPGSVRELAELGRAHDEIIRKFPIVKSNAGKQILNFNRHGAGAVVERIDSILIAAFGIPDQFAELLQNRVRDLIYAGRETTRVHHASGEQPVALLESSSFPRTG